ncbi:MAG TPA: isochorismatase family cysteine hydrolase [Lentibacillus sp.]|uniref:cysteine hydrolase family protein n=1 Tax=Lentibacillus sp. TaxID=1925746 RepID=UPI002B4B3B63|nr:isochorismatase family cysteine hydrolase [Lentibacillus sp.]HLR63607.1 isochorismatase family cysteine hydrolase [Lentibacillus sp.]
MSIFRNTKEMTALDKSNAALVLIDVQKESEFGIEGVDAVVNKTEQLIAECRKIGIPIIYTRHVNREDKVGLSNEEPLTEDGKPVFYNDGTDAVEIMDQIKPEEGDIVIDKYRWSSFFDTSLDLMLRNMGIKHLIIGGFVTDGCLMTSVFDAYFRDYQVNLIKDICGATNEGAHMASIMMMANWVYDLAIFDTPEMIKKLNGESHKNWEAPYPDQLQFTPENMRQVFKELNK